MSVIRMFLVGLFLSVFAIACGGQGLEGDHCDNDGECADGMHCHMEDGEDHGECEAEDEDDHEDE